MDNAQQQTIRKKENTAVIGHLVETAISSRYVDTVCHLANHI